MPDERGEEPTFLTVFANLVSMRTPMAPEAPGTTGKANNGAGALDQDEPG